MNISGVSAATNYAAAVRGDKTSSTEKTAKSGMSGGFIERIKAYASHRHTTVAVVLQRA